MQCEISLNVSQKYIKTEVFKFSQYPKNMKKSRSHFLNHGKIQKVKTIKAGEHPVHVTKIAFARITNNYSNTHVLGLMIYQYRARKRNK